jgi:hypothetical protein
MVVFTIWSHCTVDLYIYYRMCSIYIYIYMVVFTIRSHCMVDLYIYYIKSLYGGFFCLRINSSV